MSGQEHTLMRLIVMHFLVHLYFSLFEKKLQQFQKETVSFQKEKSDKCTKFTKWSTDTNWGKQTVGLKTRPIQYKLANVH